MQKPWFERKRKRKNVFFFFKQKTAYEVYQCDWSSDVCSSDLNAMWQKRPRGQIEKCAEAAALRKAFPEELGNDMTREEMEGQVIELDSAPATGRPTRDAYIEAPAEAADEPEYFDTISPLGEVVDALTGQDFIDWFFGELDSIPEEQVPDHIRNNIDTALHIASNGLAGDLTMSGIDRALSNAGWPPDRWQEREIGRASCRERV